MCIIGEELTAAESATGSTDKSIGRAVQRRVDAVGTSSSDEARVQRHMRKLSKALHHRRYGDMLIRNKHGQLVLPGVIRDEYGQALTDDNGRVVRAPGAPRVIRQRHNTSEIFDESGTCVRDASVRVVKKYRVGFYNGTSGGITGIDGLRAAADVTRLIGKRHDWMPAA